jgi:hypothetical protein
MSGFVFRLVSPPPPGQTFSGADVQAALLDVGSGFSVKQ